MTGDFYYKYDDEEDRVVPGYPRKISEDFGPAPNGNESIPNNVDAVLFDNRDSLLYFFKGDWVRLEGRLPPGIDTSIYVPYRDDCRRRRST